MRHRMLFSLAAIFSFTITLTMGFCLSANADIPKRCDCCEDEDMRGALRKINPWSEILYCSCYGCGEGTIIENPKGCTLECALIP